MVPIEDDARAGGERGRERRERRTVVARERGGGGLAETSRGYVEQRCSSAAADSVRRRAVRRAVFLPRAETAERKEQALLSLRWPSSSLREEDFECSAGRKRRESRSSRYLLAREKRETVLRERGASVGLYTSVRGRSGDVRLCGWARRFRRREKRELRGFGLWSSTKKRASLSFSKYRSH
jgi:hypothetical protein